MTRHIRPARRSLGRWVNRLVVLTCALGALSASSHTPGSLTEAVALDTVEQSWALYGTFETGEEVFAVHFSLEEGFALPVEVLVPEQEELADHRPWFAVVGPGLAPPTNVERSLLPFEVPDGAGVFLDMNDREDRVEYFEAFTQTNFWTTEPTALALDAGEHEIWIWSPEGTTGDFTLGLGVEEAWGPLDVLGLITGQVGPKPIDSQRDSGDSGAE